MQSIISIKICIDMDFWYHIDTVHLKQWPNRQYSFPAFFDYPVKILEVQKKIINESL